MPREREVKKLSELFAKYRQNLRAPQASVVNAFCEVVEDLLQFKLTAQKVTYRPASRILSLTQGGPLKQEILLHKADILTHLRGRLGERNAPTDIL